MRLRFLPAQYNSFYYVMPEYPKLLSWHLFKSLNKNMSFNLYINADIYISGHAKNHYVNPKICNITMKYVCRKNG